MEEPAPATFLDLVFVVLNQWRLLSVCVAVALSVGGAYAFFGARIYRSDVLLQVEDKKASLGGLDDLAAMFETASLSDTEIEVLRSRSLVGAVVDQLGLVVSVKRETAGVFDALWSRRKPDTSLRAVRFSSLDVPEEMLDQELELRVTGAGTYELRDADGAALLSGKVGEIATSQAARISAKVARLDAPVGARFWVTRRSWEEVVAELQKDLAIGERGKKTGILQVTLRGRDPQVVAEILDTLGAAYLKQNVDRKSEEAERMLTFLGTQLPALQSQLETNEAALNAYRQEKGTVDISLETKAMLDQMVEIDGELSKLEMESAALRHRFTSEHPAIASNRGQIDKLQNKRRALELQLRQVPEAELQSLRLMRDVKVSSELYVFLLNKTQELRIVKSGTVGNVRILDAAVVTRKPESPRTSVSLAMALLAGLGLGVVGAMVRNALRTGVDDPDEVEQKLGVPVFASVPFSAAQNEMEVAFARGRRSTEGILATETPSDLAVESIRSLRTALQFAMVDTTTNVIAISGPSPGIGKSFVSLNLAHLMADAGKRILLIDGDMRRGHMHRAFGLQRTPGLSDVLTRGASFKDAVHVSKDAGHVHFLASGTIPPNPAEILIGGRFQTFLDEVRGQYDLVIVDTPPILAVTDGAILGRSAALTVMVLKAGSHSMREITLAARRFAQTGAGVHGIVFNGVRKRVGHSYGYHYTYAYK